MPDILDQDLPKAPAGVGGKTFREALNIREPFLTREAGLQKEITAAEGEEAKAKQAQAETLSQGKMEAQKSFGEAEKGAMQQYEQKLQDQPLPEFIPTQDNAQSIASLFSLIGVIGMIAGKGDAQRALGAMNGMLEGHMKGRQDLYKQEKATFEKNFNSMLKKHEKFRKEMEDAVKLASTDRDAGMQAAELAATKAGSDIVKAQLRKGDLMGALNLVKDSDKGVQEAYKIDREERRHAADMAQRAQQHKELLEHQEKMAKIKTESKDKKLDDVAEELDSVGVHIADKKDRSQVQQTVNAMATLKELQKEVRDNPELVGRQGQIKKFTERYINSFKTGESEPTASESDQEALLFSKKYASMLTRYEQALAGSARSGSTVAFQKRYNDLLSQDQFNAASMAKLFDDMQVEAARGAMEKSPKITYQMMEDMADRFNTRLGAPDASPERKPTGLPKDTRPENAPTDAKQAADKHWYSPDPNRPGKYLRWD